ncbi:MAG: carbohydrate ABC transporter permease [Anaerolinea sp.]|nr:carbohydrate ABC transporter permease [Anaerolinea sp.]
MGTETLPQQAAPPTVTARPTIPGMSKTTRSLIGKALSYALLIFFALVMLLPFFWMVSTSFKPERDVFVMPPEWIPANFTLENFETLLRPTQQVNLPRAFLNSFFVAMITTVGEVFTSTLAGFAFARLRFPGRQSFFILLLITMMIPGVVTMVPSFILFRILGWVGTYLPLIIPVLLGSAFAVFLSRQYFSTLPAELEEAAKIDGANMFQIYWSIFLPLSKPIIATLFVLGFIARWNDYLGPLIYLGAGRPEEFTIPLALASLQSFYTLKWTILMAGSTLALLPIVVLFFLFQRYFVESIAITGIKG